MHLQQLNDLIGAYAAIGTHRTGSEGDTATSAWLIEELQRVGVPARLSMFTCLQAEVQQAAVWVDGQRVEGTPMHDAGFTAADGLQAPLMPLESCAPGALALVLPQQLIDPHRHPLLRGPQRAAGMVMVTADPGGQVLLRNAEHMADPLPVPVLQVAQVDAAPLQSAAARGATVTLVAEGRRQPGAASNVVGQLPGQGPPLMLLTPKSGWFRCAAERGSGVALVLALAAHRARQGGVGRPLKLLFTSGHELGYIGLKALLQQEPSLSEPGAEWMHLGASLGARHPTGSHLFASHAVWRELLAAALARHGITDIQLHAPQDQPLGEGSVITDRPFVSTMGTHRYFHSPHDLPEVAVDAERALRFGLAWQDLLDAVSVPPRGALRA